MPHHVSFTMLYHFSNPIGELGLVLKVSTNLALKFPGRKYPNQNYNASIVLIWCRAHRHVLFHWNWSTSYTIYAWLCCTLFCCGHFTNLLDSWDSYTNNHLDFSTRAWFSGHRVAHNFTHSGASRGLFRPTDEIPKTSALFTNICL